jgi:hypothetical protein
MRELRWPRTALLAEASYETAASLLGSSLERGLRSGDVRRMRTANTAIECVDTAFTAVRVPSGASNR